MPLQFELDMTSLICMYVGGQYLECVNLYDPLNGRVEVTDYTVGSLATYFCNTGFNLQGGKYRFCITGGIWRGSASTCIAEGSIYYTT